MLDVHAGWTDRLWMLWLLVQKDLVWELPPRVAFAAALHFYNG